MHWHLLMRAERVGSDTMLAHIVQMVVDAQRTRAPDPAPRGPVSAYFVPVVVLLACCRSRLGAVGTGTRMALALINAVAVLDHRLPVCLGLATPMSIMVATGPARRPAFSSRTPKRLRAWERSTRLSSTRRGRSPKASRELVAMMPEASDETEPAATAAAVERASAHPLAAAVSRWRKNAIAISEGHRFDSVTGKGGSWDASQGVRGSRQRFACSATSS